jgi:hypothetical protein
MHLFMVMTRMTFLCWRVISFKVPVFAAVVVEDDQGDDDGAGDDSESPSLSPTQDLTLHHRRKDLTLTPLTTGLFFLLFLLLFLLLPLA